MHQYTQLFQNILPNQRYQRMHRVEVRIKNNLADTSEQALVKARILPRLTSKQELTLTTNELDRFYDKIRRIFALMSRPERHIYLS
jgi:hypothetical protein